jgi:hypothetical protein
LSQHRLWQWSWNDRRSVASARIVEAMNLRVIPSVKLSIKQLCVDGRTETVTTSAASAIATATVATSAITTSRSAIVSAAASAEFTCAARNCATGVTDGSRSTSGTRRHRRGYGMTRLAGGASGADLHQSCRNQHGKKIATHESLAETVESSGKLHWNHGVDDAVP